MTSMKDLLGDRPYPYGPGYAHGSVTSRAAANSIRPHLAPVKAKIVAFLQERGHHGATYSEIMQECQLGAPTVCGRMKELVTDKIVTVSDRTRPTASGREAQVYVAATDAN